jgi:long-chain acyl-CoA synthetase
VHTFLDPLVRARRVARTRPALQCGEILRTYDELWSRCRRLAGALDGLGIGSGERVAILAANSPAYVETYLAVPASGRVVVPLNIRHAAPELAYAVRDSGAKILLTDRDPGELAALVDHVIPLDDGYEALLAKSREAPLGEGIDENTLAGLFYTGGTTGASKGVMLTHRNLVANTYHWIATAHPEPEDRFLVIAPLFHAAGSNGVLASVWTAGCQVILPTFDPKAALECVERDGITATLGVPTMIAAMTEEQLVRPRRVETLRQISHGGSPVATEVLRRAHRAFPGAELIHLYGATETAPLATTLRHEERHLDGPRARSCGQPLPGVDVRVFDPNGREVETGEGGDVVIRGPNVMAGYWKKAEPTAAVLRDGWYWSGDLGYADDEGFIFLVDRAKDMIVSGGENVYCTEVEEALYTHPAVLEAAVFGIPDEKWGETVHAVVVPRHEVEQGELIAHCRERIAGYKVPRSLELRSEPLPKSGPGKVLKRELREPYWRDRKERVS